MYVGQERNLERIEQWVKNESVPRFLLITGQSGMGRLTIAKLIGKKLSANISIVDSSVQTVRSVIDTAYTVTEPTMFIFDDADSMSPQAKNAMLKVTEEPPNNAYFVMILSDTENTLGTIRSRAVTFAMDTYSFDDKMKLTKYKEIANWCQTPEQINYYNEHDIHDLLDFCDMVVKNIDKVTGVNAFKIGNRLKYKEDSEGFDPVHFIDVVTKKLLTDRDGLTFETLIRIVHCGDITEHLLQLSKLKKESVIDMWILKIREILKEN